MGKKHRSDSQDDDHHHHHASRRHSLDDHEHKHKKSSSSRDKVEESKSTPTSPKKIETTIDLNDLGAGYSIEDKKVQRAVQYYEGIFLPYIKENYDLFKSTNYLSIKGYGTGLKGNKRRAHNATSDADEDNDGSAGGAGA